MTSRTTRLGAILSGLSLATAALLYGAASGLLALGAVIALLCVATALPRRRLPSPVAAQVVLVVAAVALSWLVAATATPLASRGELRLLTALPGGASLAALLVALPRLLMAAPGGGAPATAAIGVVSITASGLGDIGPLYPALVVVHLLLAVAALDSSDPGRPPPSRWPARRWALAGVGLVAGAAACAGAAAALPPLYDEALRVGGIVPRGARAGFSTTLRLGSLSGMLVSDEPVLRIDGPAPSHLRGVVLTSYEDGRWRAHRGDRPRAFDASTPLSPDAAATTIRRAGRDERRFFVPLSVRGISIPGSGGLVDSMGIVYPARDEPADLVVVQLGERRGPDVAPPTREDLAVPEELRPELTAIAREWTEGAATTEARLEAMRLRFERDFDYALIFHRPLGRDPVLTFLETSRRGHCEYFASAMALLARSLDVPTRVVGGFRVAELNPVGGYHVVRQRHAHAWVEAWIEGRGWTTVDPTPAGALDGSSGRTPWLAAVADLLGAWTARAAQWTARRSPLELVLAGAAALLGWLAWRAARALLRRRRRGPRAGPRGEYEPPLPELAPLLDHLARLGATRGRTEPLEAFAARIDVDGSLGPRGGAAAELLRRYAAWRFGDRGDRRMLARALQDFVRDAG